MMRAVSLKCTSCGGSLDVKPDVDELGCGYCGATLLVEREGGSVSFRQIHSAISQVRVGTDKTAAELAIVRLLSEIAETERQMTLVRLRFSKEAENLRAIFAVGGIVAALILTALLLPRSGVAALIAVIGLAIPTVYFFLKAEAKIAEREAEKLKPWENACDSLNTRLIKNRRIVDS
jgi:hypothetical protein